MKILSIESSCDETSAAVVEDGRRVLSCMTATQIETHKRFGGVVPEIASRQHTEQISGDYPAGGGQAGLSLSQLDAVAVTAYPGLIGALLVGVNFAKGLAYALQKPLVPVHHIKGHIAANYLAYPELTPPFLCLVVSGGHTQLVWVKDYTQFQVLAARGTMPPARPLTRWAGCWDLRIRAGWKSTSCARRAGGTPTNFPRPGWRAARWISAFPA